MLELLRGLQGDVEMAVACPPGPLADLLRDEGIDWLPLRGVEGSFRLHPVHTSRMLLSTALAARDLRRLWRSYRPDIIHANSIRAGIVTATTFGPVRPLG